VLGRVCGGERFDRRDRVICPEDSAESIYKNAFAVASSPVQKERNPAVEIHSLWGLPDGLQFCPYDLWEVHLPTEVATENPDYKSTILITREDGKWEYARVKNEFGRSLSIGRREAMKIAFRTAAIVERLGKACHVMWLIGCVPQVGVQFSIPWYRTDAHDAEKNLDRTNYQVFSIANPQDLEAFKSRSGSRTRHALEFVPNQDLIRNMKGPPDTKPKSRPKHQVANRRSK
jgi:hypothetical protein